MNSRQRCANDSYSRTAAVERVPRHGFAAKAVAVAFDVSERAVRYWLAR